MSNQFQLPNQVCCFRPEHYFKTERIVGDDELPCSKEMEQYTPGKLA